MALLRVVLDILIFLGVFTVQTVLGYPFDLPSAISALIAFGIANSVANWK